MGSRNTCGSRGLAVYAAVTTVVLLIAAGGWADPVSAAAAEIGEVQAEAVEPEATREGGEDVSGDVPAADGEDAEQPDEALRYACAPSTPVEGPLRAAAVDVADPENALAPILGRDPAEAAEEAKKPGKRGEFLITPIPMSNPILSSGAIVVAGYLFQLDKKDKASPPSIVGGRYMETSNYRVDYAIGAEDSEVYFAVGEAF
jgi:hypothetical protein